MDKALNCMFLAAHREHAIPCGAKNLKKNWQIKLDFKANFVSRVSMQVLVILSKMIGPEGPISNFPN
jgi:hypothetical protein